MKVQRKVNIGALTLLAVIALIMLWLSSQLTFGMDEYVFYRLSDSLPAYETSPEWIYTDNPGVLKEDDPRGAERIKEVVYGTYTTPIYAHGPLAPVLMWPAVKLLGDGKQISTTGAEVLRIIPIGLAILKGR